MIAKFQFTAMSPAEYLAWEAEQDIKHEYENVDILPGVNARGF